MKDLSVKNLPHEVNEQLQVRLASLAFSVMSQIRAFQPIDESKLDKFDDIQRLKQQLIRESGEAICQAFGVDPISVDYPVLVKEFYISNNITPPDFIS